MAASPLSPKNGAVSMVSGFAADFQSFEVTESQDTENVTVYGAAVYGSNRGTGTPTFAATTMGFAKAHAASTASGFGAMGAANGDSGASCTLTLDTGVTLAGSMVCKQIRLSHSRIRAAVPVTFDLVNGGDITTTWATS